MLWSHRLNPGPPNRFTLEPEAITEIISFGKWIFVSTALYFLASQSDRLILGKLFSLEMLGVYGIAFTLADMPRQLIFAISSKVIFPAISKLTDLPRETLRAKILQKRKFILIIAALLLTVPVSFGDLIISVLYDERYAQATWMMPILALGLWHTLLHSTTNPSLLAIGKPNYCSLGNFITFLNIIIGVPLGFYLMGKVGAIIGVALSDLPLYGAVMYGLWREGLVCIGQDLKATALFIGLLSAVLMIRLILGLDLPIHQLFN
jgi:O-antigen/teichoic acid export membrane protein